MNSFIIKDALKLLDNHQIDYFFEGNSSVIIKVAYSIDKLASNGLSFYRKDDFEKYQHLFNDTNLVLVNNSLKEKLPKGNYIFSENPSLCFNIVASMLLPKKENEINEYAIIEKDVKMGKNITIGPFSHIKEGVIIGANCIIESNCVIENAIIGDNVKIQSGVKIGNVGFGSQQNLQGAYFDFPHFGRVIIGNNVVIQDNAVINRGTLNDTIIGNNSRIGPLTWIAHGVSIGDFCFISQATTIAGSVKIGEYSTIWGNSSIRDGLQIGVNCVVGMGAVVTKNIPDSEIWVGNPARRKQL